MWALFVTRVIGTQHDAEKIAEPGGEEATAASKITEAGGETPREKPTRPGDDGEQETARKRMRRRRKEK
jgi:hypothetical protein